MSPDTSNTIGSKGSQGDFIKQQFFKYGKYWYWFVLAVTVFLVLGVLYLRYQPKVYTSVAKIKILNKGKGLELPTAAFVFSRSNINLANEIEVLKSYRIMERVVRELDLTMEYYDVGNIRTTEINSLPFQLLKTIDNDSVNWGGYTIEVKDYGFDIYRGESETPIKVPEYNTYKVKHNLPFEIKANSDLGLKSYIGKTYLLRFIPVKEAAKKLKGQINISVVGNNSDLLQINYSGESVHKLEKVINTLIQIFNEDGINDRQEVSRRTINFIDERFNYLARELDSIEGEIKDFKQENNLISLEANASLEVGKMTESEQMVYDVENQIMLSELLDETLNETDSISDLLPSNIGLESGDVNSLISQYNQLIFERNEFGVSAMENNPTVKLLNSKIKDVKQNINASLKAYKNQLEASRRSFESRNKAFTSQVSTLPGKEKVFRAIQRQQSIKESLYLFLLQKREEAAINLAITEPSVKVVEYALSNSIPISPSPKNVYLTSIIAGLALPFGIIYLIFLLNTKVKSKRDVELVIPEVPIISELPIVKDHHLAFVNPNDTSTQAEAFRILGANANYLISSSANSMDNNGHGKVIYCTSTIKGEGKTYVALNLSLALSSLNKKVLLIGADLRNPQIHNYIGKGVNKNTLGLSNYLHDANFDWKKALIKGFEKHDHHDILISGNIPPNPAQLLTNGRFEELLNEARELYDYVIVDTAPTILVTDTTMISQFADATIYLIRANYTEKNLLEFSKGLHESGRLKNMGYVLNGVSSGKSYGYNYGYSYGYGSNA
ncbi:polysaccharide biosynthesis tyrosine autokinase [Mangrovimonas sp. AS39]|uniref:GumC family protein n=1 Tax=Mangrovimonas futianensis TaxID=2895523 RepID=UPI001E5A5BEF|nr:polysaccharide biosynthesis tyrosine autokinase [Mangrovimonas futianensis]MCF1190788.1 polysaccharide biosynthesis tyrosine autokinase [Mangrovimonas futianensis]MCF1194485.1 polysaccharide biosynthesis tyrosine autokinase [Mangrovimonas futianensis]